MRKEKLIQFVSTLYSVHGARAIGLGPSWTVGIWKF